MQQYTLNLTIGKQHFSSGLFYCLFAVCALSLCLSLSYWQWQRAQAADQRYLQQQNQRFLDPVAIGENPVDYQWVKVEGWIKNIWFLDNKILEKVAGRVVLAELHSQDNVLLVNLGWQALSAGLSISHPTPEYVSITGMLKKPSKGFSLMDSKLDPNWPDLQQIIDVDALEAHLGYPLYPFVLHSDTQIGQWEKFPVTINNKFSMHSGYALQWLLLALATVIMFLKISVNTRKLAD